MLHPAKPRRRCCPDDLVPDAEAWVPDVEMWDAPGHLTARDRRLALGTDGWCPTSSREDDE